MFGYSLPLSSFVTKSSDGVRTLRATLGPAVRELVTDTLTVKVRSAGVPGARALGFQGLWGCLSVSGIQGFGHRGAGSQPDVVGTRV